MDWIPRCYQHQQFKAYKKIAVAQNPETEVLEEITEITVSGQRTGRPSALGRTGRFWRTGIDVDYLRNLGEGGSQLLVGSVVFDPVLTNKKKLKRSKSIKNWVVVEGSNINH